MAATKRSRKILLSQAQVPVPVPKAREQQIAKLAQQHGSDYAIVRNHQIQVGKEARDFLKEFSTYVGADGKASKSTLDQNGVPQTSGGAVHVAVARQIKAILGFSAADMDAAGDPELVTKAALAWFKVKPVLESAKRDCLPRKEAFALLWSKFREIAGV